MRPARQTQLIAAALALVTILAASLGLGELARTSPDQPARGLNFDVAEDALAVALVEGAKSPADLERAAVHARRALSLSPYNNNARLRLAFIDTKLHGDRLSADGAKYLAQSYDLAPYDPTLAAWRARFALEHWQELDLETRRAAQTEVRALGSKTAVSTKIRDQLQSVQNPIGRVPAQLWLLLQKIAPKP